MKKTVLSVLSIGAFFSLSSQVVHSENNGAAQTTSVIIRSDHSSGDQNQNQTVDLDFQIWDSNMRQSTPQGRIGMVGHGTDDQQSEASGRMAFYTASKVFPNTPLIERMRIDENGNVGIGNSNPNTKLVVDGITTINAPAVDWGYGLRLMASRDLTKVFTVHNNGGPEIFAIYGNGTVNAKKVYAEDIQVLASSYGQPWPDFVFEKEYELPSLYHVEEYIEENGHLENIPSAAEVSEDGISLGEMNAKLLQKIEELTLYVIQQKKEQDTLTRQISGLNQQLEQLSK